MKFEKSCGAIVYRKNRSQIELLLIKNRYGGHWSFPKGHVEGQETEIQTALREVKEETGIDINIQKGFRQMVEYYPKPNIRKQVVYFLGEAKTTQFKRQEEEISRIIWTEIHKAYHMVTFKNDRDLISIAMQNLQKGCSE
ncbi:NUDIX domain-containing protein [uncultured Negativibacillus sp.]|uniref:bis(5'-nucleosyl)-tetraphosphatase n=1 Tax=uncultured Negativibacillus sp. TaxID=1980696 RepID=UPI0025F73B3C|nr:NUDIX domain-containing protein [uncultured Negativibacillus sp.]